LLVLILTLKLPIRIPDYLHKVTYQIQLITLPEMIILSQPNPSFSRFDLSWAIVEFAGDARRRVRSCGRLPQVPCNTADLV